MTYTTPRTKEALFELQRVTTGLMQFHRNALASRKLKAMGLLPESYATDKERILAAGEPAANTAAKYRSRGSQFLADADFHGMDAWGLIEEKAGTNGAWWASKAALQFVLLERISAAKTAIDIAIRRLGTPGFTAASLFRMDELHDLAKYASILVRFPESGIPASMKGDGRRTMGKASKSKSLAGLNHGWREDVGLALPPTVRGPWLTQCVTGCRNIELEAGVDVKLSADGKYLQTKVRGAKLGINSGQLTRELVLDASEGAAKDLAAYLPKGVWVSVKLDRSLDAYRKMVARACGKTVPDRTSRKTPSAISARHQFKSDVQASGVGPVKLAEAMGHASTDTARHYGGSKGTGGGAIRPTAIRASRPVKVVPHRYTSGASTSSVTPNPETSKTPETQARRPSRKPKPH